VKRDTFIKLMMVLIFMALVANLVTFASGTKETLAQEARKVSPEFAIALSLQDVAKAIEHLSSSTASSNDNIAQSIDRLASAVEKSKSQ